MDHWVWYSLVIILSYPFVIGFLFAASFLICTTLYPETGYLLFARKQFFLYFAFLFTFFIAIFFISVRGAIFEKMGVVFKVDTIQVMFLAISIPLGVAIYHMEQSLSLLMQRYLKNTPSWAGNKLSKDKEETPINFRTLVLLSVLISFCEEFIWRGYLITVLKEGTGLWPALCISSILFGINHYYFGLHNIILKTFSGMMLGILYLLSGNIWAPFLAHTAFNVGVWRQSS